MEKPVRVRFAPSPTGPLHLGGIRTALYNYLLAKKTGGTFIIRIEDTDQNRFVPGAEDYIFEALGWCGMMNDEGPNVGRPYAPYRQSERKAMYKQYAEQLVTAGYAYYAFDTTQDLEEMRERMKNNGVPNPQYNAATREYMKNSVVLPADEVKARMDRGEPCVVRIKMPRKEEVKVHDLVRGWVVFHSSQLDDKVLFKSDGMPTYHLANVVDDYLMKITHVIRGEEWLPSAPLHVLLYRYLGWEDVMPQFAHLPLILRPDGNGKLSKRDGDRLGFPTFPINWTDPETGEKSIGFRERGFFPEPFVNMLALLGWHPSDNKEIFTMDELIKTFTIEKVGKAGARFDFEKAKWINQNYIKHLPDETLATEFKKILTEKNITAGDEYIKLVCHLLKERIAFVSNLWDMGFYYFRKPLESEYDESVVKKKWAPEKAVYFEKLISVLKSATAFDTASVDKLLHDFATDNNFSTGDLMPLLRIMTAGIKIGPGVHEIVSALGADEAAERIVIAIPVFNKMLLTPSPSL